MVNQRHVDIGDRQRAESLTRAVRKHGLLGMEKTGGNDEGKVGIQTAVVCFGRVGQMVDKEDPPKIHEQHTRTYSHTHANALSNSH